MPIDINTLRDYKGGDPEKVRQSQRDRFRPVEWVDDVLKVDEEWRAGVESKNQLRKQLNKLQKEVIAPKKKNKEPCDAEIAEANGIKDQIQVIEDNLPKLEEKRDKLLYKLGNTVDPEVPISQDEDTDNAVCALHPLPPGVKLPCPLGELEYEMPASKPMTHDDLLWRIDGYEPDRGAAVAGSRCYFLKNAGVLLNQALINFGVAFLRKKQYQPVQTPFFMKKEIMSGIAQLEDYDEQLYKVTGKTDDPEGATEKYLIATSEQPMCGYHMNDWLAEAELPLRYCGVSTCFRKEAGSSGKDIKGIFRVHQFEKIEQFVVCKDDLAESMEMQRQMIKSAEEFYQALGFSYRVVTIVSGELNDAAIKKYDLEAWFPGQQAYRELVSCSNCTDYQARAMEIRCGTKKMGQVSASYCHLLNATLCATGRGICCLLETYQEEDGVRVPPCLVPYMPDGLDFLPFVRDSRGLSKGEKGQEKAKAAAPAPAEPAKGKEKKEEKKAPAPPAPAPAAGGSADPKVAAIEAQIKTVGEELRDLKKTTKDKAVLQPTIDKLLALKNELAALSGAPPPPPAAAKKDDKKDKKDKSAPADAKPKQQKPPPAPKPAGGGGGGGGAGGDVLSQLDAALATRSYIAGFAPSASDNVCYAQVSVDPEAADATKYPNVVRWLTHISSFSPAQRAAWQ